MKSIEQIKPKIKECFYEALKHDPTLAGGINVKLILTKQNGQTIIESGEVTNSETLSPFFDMCVLNKTAKLAVENIPFKEKTLVITYPFIFDPGVGFGGEENE